MREKSGNNEISSVDEDLAYLQFHPEELKIKYKKKNLNVFIYVAVILTALSFIGWAFARFF